MSSIIRSRVSVPLIPNTNIQVWFVQDATLSASVLTNIESSSFVKSPEEVGSERPCPAGIAIAVRPSLNLSASVIKTS